MIPRPILREAKEQNDVAPHEFIPLGRIRHRKKCRHCYLHKALHPVGVWAVARPLKDKADSPSMLIRKGTSEL